MMSFLIDNLDHVEGFGEREQAIESAVDRLFPDEHNRAIVIVVPSYLRETAVGVLRDFARRADATAVEHEQLVKDRQWIPCAPRACRAAANACRYAADRIEMRLVS